MSDMPHATPDEGEEEGRFFLLSGPGADEAAQALTALLPRAASVDGAVVAGMFTTLPEGTAPVAPDLEQVFLRYTAGIALADSFRLAGYDAVVAEDIPAAHLEAYLDFASPATVHLVRVGGDPGDGLPGLCLDPAPPADLAARIAERAEEARVETASADGATDT